MKKNKKRIMGVDYGLRRIGLSISDSTQRIAFPYNAIILERNTDIKASAEKFFNTISHKIDEIEKFVVGFPLHLNGKEGEMTQKVTEFCHHLKSFTTIIIELCDERLTSVLADRILKEEMKLNRKKRHKYIDITAATILLQNYLDSKSNKN